MKLYSRHLEQDNKCTQYVYVMLNWEMLWCIFKSQFRKNALKQKSSLLTGKHAAENLIELTMSSSCLMH